MAIKHPVTDSVSDSHFIVDPNTREIVYDASNGKRKLMQYDHNSERFTFEVPRYIENHDMSQCDVIQVHYVNSSVGTSASVRKTYRGVHIIDDVTLESEDAEVITFSWLVPETATMYAGPLRFQLKFICHDNENESIVGYKWHTETNSDMTVTAGLPYAESEIDPATTATLQSLDIVETENGIDIILDGVHYHLYNGNGGSTGEGGSMGQLPEPDTGDNTKIVEVVNGEYVIKYPSDSSLMNYLETITVTDIDENSTDGQYTTAKAVYSLLSPHVTKLNTLTSWYESETYKYPTLSASSTPNGGTYEKGDTQTVTKITASVTKGTSNVVKLEALDGNTVVETIEGTDIAGSQPFENISIKVSSNKNFSVKATCADGKTKDATTGSFTFVYPYYWGVVAEDATVDTVNEAAVKTLSKQIKSKGTQKPSFTANNQKMVFASPYAVTKITDPNGLTATNTFTKNDIEFTCLDGTKQTYYVYVANIASTVSAHVMTFTH